MRGIVKSAVLGLGMLAIAGAAAAQEGGGPPPPRGGAGGPPGGFTPPPPVAAPLWPLEDPYENTNPILFADLDLGGPAGFTGVLKPGNQLCYILSVPGIEGASGAGIVLNDGARTVVPLKAPEGGSSGGCVSIQADLANGLVTNPGDYSINVVSKSLTLSAAHGKLETQGAGQKWAAGKF
jgi:hypothetical protein